MSESPRICTLKKRIEKLEKENEYLKLFKLGLDSMRDRIFIIINRHYCCEAVSKGCQHAFNKNEEEFIGKHAIEILGKKVFLSCLKPNCDKSLNGEFSSHSAWVTFPDSKKKHLAVQYYPVSNGTDTIAVTILARELTSVNPPSIQNHTHCIKPTPMIHTGTLTDKPYHTIIQTATDGFFICDPQGKVLEVNDSFCKMLGYRSNELLRLNISDLHVSQTPERAARMFEDIFQKGTCRYTAKYRCKDGTFIDVEITTQYSCIKHGAIISFIRNITKKNTLNRMLINHDIFHQKSAEQQQMESEELLLMIVDSLPEPLIMVDHKMDIIMMNMAAEKYFKNKHCLGRKCYKIFKKTPKRCKECKVSLGISNCRKESFERKGLMDPRKLEKIFINPLQTKGKTWAAIVRITDITNEKKIEQNLIQADKMISLGVLVSGVGHEINSPNNIIMLNTPILWKAWEGIKPVIETYYKKHGDFNLAGLPYSDMREEIPLLFSGIKEGSKRIRQIIQDLKNFSRQGDTTMYHLFNMNEVIKKAIRLTNNLIKQKTEQLTIDYGPSLPLFRGNPQKIEQVLVNLIENACQALSSKKKNFHLIIL